MSGAGTELESALSKILEGGSITVIDWSADWPRPETLGLSVRFGRVTTPTGWEPYRRERILEHLDAHGRTWLSELVLLSAIGSTNDLAMSRAASGSIEGLVLLAEMQTAGRGRRGREWVSPLAGSLSLTLGFDFSGPIGALSGLSPVVGLAALDGLTLLGAANIGLKWPNDLLSPRGKLAGVLIELLPAGAVTRVIIGIGINLEVTDVQRIRVDQPIDDLRTVCGGAAPDRSAVAGVLVSHIVRFVDEFRKNGFQPFMSAYDAHHVAQDRSVLVREGNRERVARVLGIERDGGLKIEVSDTVEILRGGEVSLRV
ncbi:MAG: biotin--[acetyl-CoA-carboxylase] ligase [Pseudomonadales bacterium]